MRRTLYILLSILLLASCKGDDTLRNNNVTMGNVTGECIISDQGNSFQVAESLIDFELRDFDGKRVLVVCDVLKETADRSYDIRLTGITEVLTKNIKSLDDSTPEEDLTVDDPIIMRDIWYAGGYINIYFEFAVKEDSTTPHYINLLDGDVDQESNTYTFTFRHNAKGEVPSEDDKAYSSSWGYASFPVADLISGDEAKIILKWKSHKFKGGGYSLLETQDIVKEYRWIRAGHEHTPTALHYRSSPAIL